MKLSKKSNYTLMSPCIKKKTELKTHANKFNNTASGNECKFQIYMAAVSIPKKNLARNPAKTAGRKNKNSPKRMVKNSPSNARFALIIMKYTFIYRRIYRIPLATG